METNKLFSFLGLARRAGKLSMGHDAAVGAVVGKKAKMLIFASDTSERLKREFEVLNKKHNIDIPVFVPEITISQIHYACGYKAGVITVNDENFCKKIISILESKS